MNKKNNKDKVNITIDSKVQKIPGKERSQKGEIVVPEKPDTKFLKLPVLPLNDIVIFPYTLSTLVIDNEATIKFIMKIADGERLLTLFPDLSNEDTINISSIDGASSKNESAEVSFDIVKVKDRHLSRTGVIGRIVKLLKFPDNTVRVLVRGLKRVRIINILTKSPNITATVEEISDLHDNSIECIAMAKNAQNQFQEIISLSPNFPEELKVAILNVEDYSRLADLIADTLNINFTEKLGILTGTDTE